MDIFDFVFEMQKEIIRLQGLPKDIALSLLADYLVLKEDNYKLQEQLIYAIKNDGEYLEMESQFTN